ncbi:hypothetical protein QTN25_009508 [Entamoeba marina]
MKKLFTEPPLIGYKDDGVAPILSGKYLDCFINTHTPFAPIRSVFAQSTFIQSVNYSESQITFSVPYRRFNEYIISSTREKPIFKPFTHHPIHNRYYRVLLRLFDYIKLHDALLISNQKSSSCIIINNRRFNLNNIFPPLCTTQKRALKYVLNPLDITDYIQVGINQITIIIDNYDIENVACIVTESIPINKQSLLSRIQRSIRPLPPLINIEMSESEMEPEIIDTLCAITYKQLVFPVKGVDCDHSKLFDLSNYIDLVQIGQYFNCPICDKPCLLCDLICDEELKGVLERINDKNVIKIAMKNETFKVIERLPNQFGDDLDEIKYFKQKLTNTTSPLVEIPHKCSPPLSQRKRSPAISLKQLPFESHTHKLPQSPSPKPQKDRNAPPPRTTQHNQQPTNKIFHTKDTNGVITYSYPDGSTSFIKSYVAPQLNNPPQYQTEPFQFSNQNSLIDSLPPIPPNPSPSSLQLLATQPQKTTLSVTFKPLSTSSPTLETLGNILKQSKINQNGSSVVNHLPTPQEDKTNQMEEVETFVNEVDDNQPSDKLSGAMNQKLAQVTSQQHNSPLRDYLSHNLNNKAPGQDLTDRVEPKEIVEPRKATEEAPAKYAEDSRPQEKEDEMRIPLINYFNDPSFVKMSLDSFDYEIVEEGVVQ